MKNILLFLYVPLFIVFTFSSCINNSQRDALPAQTAYQQPVVQPLKFDKVKNIDPTGVKTITVRPVVKTLAFSKLPLRSYDTAVSRPVHYDTEETTIGYNTLPAKDFDIEKLPSKPLKLFTTKLPQPKLIKCGQPHLKDANLLLYELNEAQGLQGTLATCVFTDKKIFYG